jgi:hypothetical protein
MKPHIQIDWIKTAAGDTKKYRAMVIGWQNSVSALNTQIAAYNREVLKTEAHKNKNPHHGMGEIAIKKHIIASLRELKLRLDDWKNLLQKLGFDMTAIEAKRREFRYVLPQAEKLKEVRNTAFHYGDFLHTPDELIATYSEVEKWDDAKLNQIWRALEQLGDAMKREVLRRC